MRLGLARTALDLHAHGADLETAARAALGTLETRVGARAGLILVSRNGAVAIAHSTATMPAAVRRG
jgi:isoaspartyl peptidase/L-asparaginase-like protein (Ntn-hydrolase superfamily)